MALTQLSQDAAERRTFILKLAKALLSFGAPSHRIESQLAAASDILNAQAGRETFPCLFHWYLSASTRKNLFTYQTSSLLQYETETTRSTRTHFVRATGRIALTSLHQVHMIYRDVLHDKMGAEAGTEALRQLLQTPPIYYSLVFRCALAFVCASIICVLAFGGSIIDMWISGSCACVLQYLGLNCSEQKLNVRPTFTSRSSLDPAENTLFRQEFLCP